MLSLFLWKTAFIQEVWKYVAGDLYDCGEEKIKFESYLSLKIPIPIAHSLLYINYNTFSSYEKKSEYYQDFFLFTINNSKL